VKALAQGNNEFAWDMYGKLKGDKGNLFFSPFSLRTALAMTYAGAKGETAAQMEKTLRFAPQDPALHAAFASTIQSIEPGEKGGYTLTVANSLWGQKDYGFLKPFLETCKANYGSGLTEVDFIKAFEQARGNINLWVEDKTNQKIKDLIPPGGLDNATRLVLVNAVWFKGDWLSQFKKNETQDAPFYLDATEKVTAPLMHRLGKGYRYAEADAIQVLELPYQGDKLAMVVLLPKEKDGIGKLETMLTAEKIAAWVGSLRAPEKTDVYLPKFKMTYGTKEMADPFKAMGMVLPFGAADFSGMDGRKDLFISLIFHKAFVDVNEEGTEAAAATAVVMKGGAPPAPPVFRADHPFVFLIRDKASGNILFLGRLVNPQG
jgi:serpin B